jgi:hypothetical protein
MAINKEVPKKSIRIENLLIAGIAAYYLAQVFATLWNSGFFNNLGADYLSFWSSGHIANTQGYRFIYDLKSQAAIQILYAPIDRQGVVPTPLFPVFLIPFQIMALIPPGISFVVWTVINVSVLFVYMKKRLLTNLPVRYLGLAILAIPCFLNMYFGQVEVWLMIFISEFLIAWRNGELFKSGLWLGLALLKPQILILLVPYLLLNRYWKVLGGFLTSALIIFIFSLLLVGVSGLLDLIKLWLGYSTGLPSNAPEVMMNWRMLGIHASRIISKEAGITVVVVGTFITLLFCLPLWRGGGGGSFPLVALFGILAATLAVTWHSHQHMAMTLIPFLFILLQEAKITTRLFQAWIMIPIGSYLFVILIVIIFSLFSQTTPEAIGGLITGTCMLVFNLLFLHTARKLYSVQSPNLASLQ